MLFPRDAVIRRVNIEPAIGLGAGRALLLQLAHPAIAAGVEDHSDFRRNPFKRLQGTLEAIYAAVFGSEEVARGVGRRVARIHDFVTGPTYRANDPQNLLWVHATLVDTALDMFSRYIGPLPDDQAEQYYQQMMVVAELFGVPPAEQPATLSAFRQYFEAMVASLEITETGKALGRFVLDPVLPYHLEIPMRPAVRFAGLLSVGYLPPALREQFGFVWTPSQAATLRRTERSLRAVFGILPRPVRTAGPRANGAYLLHLARRHGREFDRRAAAR